MFVSPAKEKVKASKYETRKSRLRTVIISVFVALTPFSFADTEAAETRQTFKSEAAFNGTELPALPSFSALVDRVAPAVVAVHVKARPAAMAGREEEA